MSLNKNNTDLAPKPAIGVILAGGLSRRMGGQDKSLLPLGGVALINHAINRAQGQVEKLIISAPKKSVLDEFGLDVVEDSIPGFAGPLAGVLSALEWTEKNYPAVKWLATFAVDAPFMPTDMVEKFITVAGENNYVMARSMGRDHPVFALWPISAKEELRLAIKNDGLSRVGQWFENNETLKIDFSPTGSNSEIDPFFNVNTVADAAVAEKILADENL
ncbi:MAG: molybdenum cofactor guanylyltransferase MobA [Rhodospirillaceae bacterium]|nr:molybdenum cofactor guanylyltransferase MobA [Rhodospirillaceae bacterium]